MKPTLCALLFALTQVPAAPKPFTVKLEPRAPEGRAGLRWSPKGAKVPLAEREGSLEGRIVLGPEGTPAVAVRLSRTSGAAHIDALELDFDRDGSFSAAERLATKPSEQRAKWWSSFDAVLALPLPAEAGATAATRPYPLALWYVEDPQEPDAPRELRWSRRGWHEGELEIDGKKALVLITEMEMDGVFDQRDAWALARERAQLLASSGRALDGHVWLDGLAYRPVSIDPHGRSLSFERFDPGFTEAEEAARNDTLAADRNAPRADKPLAFGKDLAAALAEAKRDNKRVLVDFETTWCGPCKTMNELVYTAAPVVAAAKDVIGVKLDGDEQRALAKQYRVEAYPTIILLAADGTEVRRAVGYRSVKEMVKLLAP